MFVTSVPGKGNLLEVARMAGIQAAKRTGELIPFCHPLPLDHVDAQVTVSQQNKNREVVEVGLRNEQVRP